MNATKCQMQDKDRIHVGKPQPVLLSRRGRMMLTLARKIDPRIKRFLKERLKWFTTSQTGGNHPVKSMPGTETKQTDRLLKSGDTVRIRQLTDIRATLNSNGRLKGCKFMPEMEQYCGTIQQVFKPVERFLNECDYTVRKANGLVLLDNLYCQGIVKVGPCDRSCFYFWRTEWLEYIERGEKL